MSIFTATPPGGLGSPFGFPVYVSEHVKPGDVFVACDPARPGSNATIHLHWISLHMAMNFDHDLWWRETPAETARRITLEVLAHHGEDPADYGLAPTPREEPT